MTIIREAEFGVIKGKTISTTAFLSKLSKIKSGSLHSLFTDNGNFIFEYDGEGHPFSTMTRKGFRTLVSILFGYISNDLRQGQNIAEQSMATISNEQYLVILNTLQKLNKWKQSKSIDIVG